MKPVINSLFFFQTLRQSKDERRQLRRRVHLVRKTDRWSIDLSLYKKSSTDIQPCSNHPQKRLPEQNRLPENPFCIFATIGGGLVVKLFSLCSRAHYLWRPAILMLRDWFYKFGIAIIQRFWLTVTENIKALGIELTAIGRKLKCARRTLICELDHNKWEWANPKTSTNFQNFSVFMRSLKTQTSLIAGQFSSLTEFLDRMNAGLSYLIVQIPHCPLILRFLDLVALPPCALNLHPFPNDFASVANILRPFSNNLHRVLPIVATLSPSRPMIAIPVLCLQVLNRMIAGRYKYWRFRLAACGLITTAPHSERSCRTFFFRSRWGSPNGYFMAV